MALNVQHANGLTGFWGAATSTLDWCEENYHHTHYIAEFWNTISNFVYIVAGITGAFNTHQARLPLRITVMSVWLTVVGIGSLAFHATLKYSMQLLDEVPMLFGSCHLLYCLNYGEGDKEDTIMIKLKKSPIPYYSVAILATLAYLLLKNPILFLSTYALLVISSAINFPFYVTEHLPSDSPTHQTIRKLLYRALAAFLVAFAVWNIDNLWCGRIRELREVLPEVMRPLLQLHAWWHVLSMVAATQVTTAVTAVWVDSIKQDKQGREWRRNWSFILDTGNCWGLLPRARFHRKLKQ